MARRSCRNRRGFEPRRSPVDISLFLYYIYIYIYIYICKEIHPKLSQICSYGIFSKELKNEFEIAVVNEPSVFELLKVQSQKQRVWHVQQLNSDLTL